MCRTCEGMGKPRRSEALEKNQRGPVMAQGLVPAPVQERVRQRLP